MATGAVYKEPLTWRDAFRWCTVGGTDGKERWVARFKTQKAARAFIDRREAETARGAQTSRQIGKGSRDGKDNTGQVPDVQESLQVEWAATPTIRQVSSLRCQAPGDNAPV